MSNISLSSPFFSPAKRSSDISVSTSYLPSAVDLPTPLPLPTLRPLRSIEPLPSITPQHLNYLKPQPTSSAITTSSTNGLLTKTNNSSSVTALHQSTAQRSLQGLTLNNTNSTTNKITSLVHPRQSETVSVVRPVINDTLAASCNGNHRQALKPQKSAIVFPEPQTRAKATPSPDSPTEPLIPEARDRPAGLDMDEFLPKHLQDTMRLGYQPQPEISETEAMTAIVRGHKSLITVLSHRRKNLHIILAMWSTKDSRAALEQAIHLEDQSVIVDILNVVSLKP